MDIHPRNYNYAKDRATIKIDILIKVIDFFDTYARQLTNSI